MSFTKFKCNSKKEKLLKVPFFNCRVSKEDNGKGGFVITQTFLDKDNEMVVDELGRLMGCKMEVARLDSELLDSFGNDNMIVVE